MWPSRTTERPRERRAIAQAAGASQHRARQRDLAQLGDRRLGARAGGVGARVEAVAQPLQRGLVLALCGAGGEPFVQVVDQPRSSVSSSVVARGAPGSMASAWRVAVVSSSRRYEPLAQRTREDRSDGRLAVHRLSRCRTSGCVGATGGAELAQDVLDVDLTVPSRTSRLPRSPRSRSGRAPAAAAPRAGSATR